MFKTHTLWLLVGVILCSGCYHTDANNDVVDVDLDSVAPEEGIDEVSETVAPVNSALVAEIPPVQATEEETVVSPTPEVEEAPEPVHFDVDCYDWSLVPGGPRVSVAYANCDDKSSTLSASRIVQLTQLLIDVWEERGYPEVDAVREHLSRYTILAVHTEDGVERSPELARLKHPDIYTEDPAAAIEKMGDGDAFCFPNGNARYVDVNEKSKFFIVLGSHILTEGWVDIVVHEIAHGVLWRAYGDADGGHKRDDVWLGHGPDTLLDEVLDRFWN